MKPSYRPEAMTWRRMQVLRFYVDYRAEHGCCPTLEQAGQKLGINRATVFEHVKCLLELGVVRRVGPRLSTVEPTPQAIEACESLLGKLYRACIGVLLETSVSMGRGEHDPSAHISGDTYAAVMEAAVLTRSRLGIKDENVKLAAIAAERRPYAAAGR